MKVQVTVVSKTPPGGRCELYNRMLFEVVRAYRNVSYTLVPADIYDGEADPPVVLVGRRRVEPEDGVMVTPDELLAALKAEGAELREGCKHPSETLWKLYDEFLGDL